MIIDFASFFPDGRGDPLERFEWADSDEKSATLLLRGPSAVATQLKLCFGASGIERRELEPADSPDWTHRFEVPTELVEDVQPMLELLSRTLLIPCEAPMYALIALGFYKDPRSSSNSMEWNNAPAGELIARAKYAKDAGKLDELVTELADVIETHPLYADHGQAVISVPGHRSAQVSFSEVLAAAVAERTQLPLVKVSGQSAERPQAKSEERANLDLSHEFVVEGDISGKVVIVVDDVYMSGKTMKNIAAVLSDSGARAVIGLVGARTLKAS
ncbi:MAG: hypothetical protein HYX29_11690 [Solirubrobacterales bacterium]|nr:hypothetical protein [Solirubrobacterales bacterium]